MEPKSTPNHEKLVLGVPWGLPGGTLGPKRGQSEKKGGTWDFLTPPLGAHFETFLRRSRQKVDPRRRFFREPCQAPFLEANCRKRGHHSPAKCSKNVGFYGSGAKSPCCEKSRLDDCPGVHFGALLEPLLLPLGTESEPEDDFWKGSKNGRKKGIEGLGKSGQERAGAGRRGGGSL